MCTLQNIKRFMRGAGFGVFFIMLSSPSLLLASDALSKDDAGTASVLCPEGLESMVKDILLSSELFEEGKVFLKKKNYDMARVKFQEALLKDPGNKKARKYLALCDQECVEIKKETVVKTEKSEAKKDDLEFIQALDSKIERLEKTPVPVTAAAEENSEADLKKVKKAERLIKQGNEYYSESKYEEAYQLYQEARQILRSSEYSQSNQI